MKRISLDPRVNRMDLPEENSKEPVVGKKEFWPTYEVFHQKKRGAQQTHVGILHAPNPEMAMVFAKEQFGRRGKTTNLWVVRSSEIYATSYDDDDIFETTPGKQYREPGMYKIREKVRQYKERNK